MDIDKMNLADAAVTQLLIPIDDFERGVAFYRDVLGLPFLFAAPPQMAFFQCGAVRLLVGVTPAGQKVQRGSQIYFGSKTFNLFTHPWARREWSSRRRHTS